jgi:phosphoglycerate dehydrogenase-like enzyme
MPHIVLDVRIQDDGLRRLQSIPHVRVTTLEPLTLHGAPRELPAEIARDADLLVCILPPQNHAELKQLKFVQLATVGFSQLYGLDLVERGVRACNARGVFDTAIAEWNIAMMINLGRDLRGMIRNQDQGRWETADRFAYEVRGSVVGLWGYGGIGRETARQARALGMRVHALTRRGISPRGDVYAVPGTGDPEGTLPDRVFTSGQELEFLAGLDFLVLAMPHLPANTGLIGERELRALKPTAFLLNPARGPLVQEQALVRALQEGGLRGRRSTRTFTIPCRPTIRCGACRT